jgi:hypothetical protein
MCEWDFERLRRLEAVNMPKCYDCANFEVSSRFCKWYNAYLTEKSANKNVRCDGFKLAEKHHRIPDMKLVRVSR